MHPVVYLFRLIFLLFYNARNVRENSASNGDDI
jgi:hypothetical protein